MKTRYKILITILAIVLLYVVIVEVDNYFYDSFHQTSISERPDCAVMWPSVYGTSNCEDHDDDKPEPIKINITRIPGDMITDQWFPKEGSIPGFFKIPDDMVVSHPFGSNPQKQKESEELWKLATENANYTVYNEEGILNLDLILKQLHEYCEINYLPACKDLPIINLNGSYP